MGRHRGKYQFPLARRDGGFIIIPQEMMRKFDLPLSGPAYFTVGVRHRGIWREHRYGVSGVLAHEYVEALACPLCLASPGAKGFAMMMPADRARRTVLMPRTTRVGYWDPRGFVAVTVCDEHNSGLRDLYWYQLKEQVWRSTK